MSTPVRDATWSLGPAPAELSCTQDGPGLQIPFVSSQIPPQPRRQRFTTPPLT